MGFTVSRWIETAHLLICCGATSGTGFAVPEGNREWDIQLHNKWFGERESRSIWICVKEPSAFVKM